ncbi:hypothetical protein ACN1T8_003779 [Vibrio cholerae]|uniref:hypothetical protein n=1 Tax=Vibrio cholerae TaxID=666 RepID=UPI001C92DFC7|nr:hypothetical protein [Vibrio cholerae]MBY4642172.1 hypothetical protein [Vibrio cholerae]MCR9658444.1 hypothetical protein [Vibrio cholerae]MCR9689126.1 hypothetical protein [Vibrio cholerae]MCR9746457.1 hypothetical protein [Vibrio cholerae]
MAMDAKRLEEAYVARFEEIGGRADGDHAWFRDLARLLAEETVKEITSHAKADIKTGSSAGQHSIV